MKLSRNILSMPNNRVEKMLKTKRVNILMSVLVIGVILISMGTFQVAQNTSRQHYLVSYSGGGITQLQLDDTRRSFTASDEVDDKHLLDFLIDEALLVERAKALGVVESDTTIRKALSRSLIDQASREAVAEVPSTAELEAFYRNHKALFQSAEKTRIKVFLLKENSNNGTQVQAVRDRLLQQENISEYLSPYISALPSGYINLSALPKYIGPSLALAAASLRKGDVSQPIVVGEKIYLISCGGYIESQALAFAEVKDEVLLEFQRRQRDKALRNLLNDLWDKSSITITEQLGFTVKDIQQGDSTDG
ncbi:peptidyl-prolyl cis-trans isomerase [Maricurvus nonylphenolicus]|uniref:peptidylprolyl isomerase n=1 Tax=Maricurvus nonylphenolicus TaxID=1008307 RepID=UPI0036F30A0F